jgi:MazG family protein
MRKPPSTPDTNREAKLKAFDRLLTIMDELRENCPWDKKQTLESLRHLTIEETYELSDSILDGDLSEIKKELGDLMLHNVFYARIASEMREFDMADVLNSICDKLIERHPHVYGDVVANDDETVKANWERIKLKSGNKSVLEGVPKSLPALVKAIRIQDKARGIGFDWEKKEQVWERSKRKWVNSRKNSTYQMTNRSIGQKPQKNSVTCSFHWSIMPALSISIPRRRSSALTRSSLNDFNILKPSPREKEKR